YTVMPLSGWLIAALMGLPPELAVGLILVACCPGGTASNMIAYIGRASVALSVVSTAVSTLLGIVMTPVLCKVLAGHIVDMDAWGMFCDVIKIVLVPVAAGVFINYKFPAFVKRLGQTGPVVSTLAIVFISGGIIAPQDKAQMLEQVWLLLSASFLLHAMGFGFGYALSHVFGYEKSLSKAVACETGMQNGGLAAVLARNTFPALMPLVALPAAFCSIMQTVIGGVLATVWRFADKEVK
ncbi:MAG: bile acid:sodium symporter family protein, partial [Alistipes sp.]